MSTYFLLLMRAVPIPQGGPNLKALTFDQRRDGASTYNKTADGFPEMLGSCSRIPGLRWQVVGASSGLVTALRERGVDLPAGGIFVGDYCIDEARENMTCLQSNLYLAGRMSVKYC